MTILAGINDEWRAKFRNELNADVIRVDEELAVHGHMVGELVRAWTCDKDRLESDDGEEQFSKLTHAVMDAVERHVRLKQTAITITAASGGNALTIESISMLLLELELPGDMIEKVLGGLSQLNIEHIGTELTPSDWALAMDATVPTQDDVLVIDEF